MSNDDRGIPTKWAWTTIGDVIASLPDGRTLHHGWSPQCETEPSSTPDDWGVLKTTAVQAGQFLPHENKKLPADLEPKPTLEVKPGDLLLTCAGPRARCGVPCLVRQTRPRLILSGKMYRFRPVEGVVDAAYLEKFLLSADAQQAIDRMKTGISDSGLNLTHDRFRQLRVPIAPYPEQLRIVEELEKQFTRLDAAVEALHRVQTLLKRYRASVLKAACEGRLVPTEAELARRAKRDYEPADELLAHILKERRDRWEADQLAKFRAAGKPPKDEKWKAKYVEPEGCAAGELPELPTGWCWATADQLTRRITDGEHITPPRTESGVCLISARNVLDGRLALDDVDYISEATHSDLCRRLTVEPGDLLLSCSGSVGRSCLVPSGIRFSMVRSVAVLKLLGPSPDYLWLATVSPVVQSQINRRKTQTAQANIFQEAIKKLAYPFAPGPEQMRICQSASAHLSSIEATQRVVSAALAKANGARSSLLNRAFAGQLVPQDSKDEPASKLLERIRASTPVSAPKMRTKRTATTEGKKATA